MNYIRSLKIKIAKKVINRLMPPPVLARHKEYTMFFSLDDDIAHPSHNLLDLSIKAIQEARTIRLDDVVERFGKNPVYPDPNEWPGDHYRLLAALVKILKPQVVIEIGTGIGTGTLSLKKYMPSDGRITTFDIIKWDDFPSTLFTKEDFYDNKITQIIDDISNPHIYDKYRNLFENASLILVDALKDGIQEKKYIQFFNSTAFVSPPIIIFDDIKYWSMLKVWREIEHPKIDMTSFGHFTGTGIVEWINHK